MVGYFIGVYIINRTLHGRLEIRNLSSRVEKIFQHSKRNLVSPRGHVNTLSLFIFFPSFRTGRILPNPAIWLVPRAGGILPSSPLTRPGGIVGSFIHKFVCCLWKSKNCHFQTIFLLKLALLLALAREKWILLFRQKFWRENQAVSLKNRLSKAKQVARDVASLLVCNRAVSTAILLLCTVYWTFLLCL